MSNSMDFLKRFRNVIVDILMDLRAKNGGFALVCFSDFR
jgi:hypothetical protein